MAQGCYFFLCNQNFLTDSAMLAFRQAGVGTVRRNRCIHNLGMTLNRNYNYLTAQFTATNCAVSYNFIAAGCGTGSSSFILIDCISDGMVLHGHSLLFYQNCITDRAVLAFRQAGSGTGGFHSLIDHFFVAQCRNFFLGNQNLAADRAVLAFRQTRSSTSGCHRSIHNFGMTQLVNNGLLFQNLFTAGAVLAFRQTGFGTGGCYRFIYHFHVVQRCNQLFLTNCTNLVCFTGRLFAGCMTLCRNHFCIGFFAAGTGLQQRTVFCTGGFLGNHTVIPAVSQFRDFTAAFCVITAGTMGAGGFALFCTGRLLLRIIN